MIEYLLTLPHDGGIVQHPRKSKAVREYEREHPNGPGVEERKAATELAERVRSEDNPSWIKPHGPGVVGRSRYDGEPWPIERTLVGPGVYLTNPLLRLWSCFEYTSIRWWGWVTVGIYAGWRLS